MNGDGYVIRLSRSPAIPTFYARDRKGDYASSQEASAIHFASRFEAGAVNLALTLNGVVECCRCLNSASLASENWPEDPEPEHLDERGSEPA